MHEGHRQRMIAKLKSGEVLFDHEILEILLYTVYPRINTNPLAHRLLDRFCSLSEIFKASTEELERVEGVGEKVAEKLRCIGLCYERVGHIEGAAVLKTLGDCKDFVSMRLRGKSQEFLELYFLEKSGRLTRIYTYTSADRNRVETDAKEITCNIALSQPHGILVAHNHVNAEVDPSEQDDNFTKQIQLICNINNVKFWDHLIYARDKFYSYNESGKLQEISRKYSLNNAMKWINNLN